MYQLYFCSGSSEERQLIFQLIRDHPDPLLDNPSLPDGQQSSQHKQDNNNGVMDDGAVLLGEPDIIVDKVEDQHEHPPRDLVHLALFL